MFIYSFDPWLVIVVFLAQKSIVYFTPTFAPRVPFVVGKSIAINRGYSPPICSSPIAFTFPVGNRGEFYSYPFSQRQQ